MPILTEEYGNIIRNEKIKRLSFLFVVLLIIAGSVGIVFMSPSYFSVVFSKDSIVSRLKASEESLTRIDFKSTEAEVSRINNLIVEFEKNESMRRTIAPLLIKIANTTPPAIALKALRLDAKKGASAVLNITGKAETREIFLDYFEKLKKFNEAEAVISPITNLLKETDLDFSLEFKIKNEFYGYAQEK